jgi:cysteine desulfurase
VAAAIGAHADDVVFTASGSEANNAVVFEVERAARLHHDEGGEIVLASCEHPSIRRAAERCAEMGMKVRSVAPGRDGVVAAEAILAEVGPGTRLVCLMLANNELGTLQPVAEVARLCRERGIPVLADAVQAVGKIAVDVHTLGVDYLTLGGHKFGGPLGAGALWIRKGAPFEGLLVGGGQERRRRASTENVPAIAGLGEAAALAREEMPARTAYLAALRDRFESGLGAVPGAVVHCAGSPRLPNTSHLAILEVEGESLLIRLDLAGFAVSTGSACSSGAVEPSRTLLAAGIPAAEALSSIRVSFGPENTPEEVDAFLAALGREAAALRRVSALAAPGIAAGERAGAGAR